MKKILRLALALATVCFAGITVPGQQRSEAPLTNNAVIKLVRAGFKEKTVIAIIRSRPSQFDLSPDRLIELKRGGVSENVILAMLASDGGAEFADDDGWGDDPFFNSGARPDRQGGGTGGGSDIFGMNGGSSSSTRDRGATKGGGEDTQTSGSATVRILRPPAEAGGSPKLERTPTLTNESIVELVEAGFSEGTIIRRIEQSPAEFDLSPAKLAELRRRRVTDKVIAAMTAAMSDDPAPAANPRGSSPEK